MTTTIAKPTTETHRTIQPDLLRWRRATKTRPIWAKHIQNVLCDKSVAAKLLLSTIEADQMLKATSLICRGEAGDVWQQSPETLLKKYDVTAVDSEGWMVCTPKVGNAVDCFITFAATDFPSDIRDIKPGLGFSIKALWGERQPDGSYLQFGNFGDVICHSLEDPNDYWIVQRKLFDATYQLI